MLRSSDGFTLIELVIVIVLLGILAVVALPRLNIEGFDEYGYLEETASAIRYAQQIAVARNGTVSMSFTGNAYRVSCGTACTGAETGQGGFLLNPANGRPWNGTAKTQGQAPAGVSISGDNLAFNGLGQPSAGATISIGTRNITVQAETGHVRIE